MVGVLAESPVAWCVAQSSGGGGGISVEAGYGGAWSDVLVVLGGRASMSDSLSLPQESVSSSMSFTFANDPGLGLS